MVIILSLLTNNSGSGWAEQLSSEGQLLVQGPALLTLVEQKGQNYCETNQEIEIHSSMRFADLCRLR